MPIISLSACASLDYIDLTEALLYPNPEAQFENLGNIFGIPKKTVNHFSTPPIKTGAPPSEKHT